MPDVELHEARTMDEAFALMDRLEGARLLAGGTDLLVDLKARRAGAGALISIKRIDSLKGVAQRDGNLHIGALTTITELNATPIVRDRFPAIFDATRKMAAPQIRNVATVGGNVVSAVPCADLPPVFLVMNASAIVQSSESERRIPLESFFRNVRQTSLATNEMLTAIVVPAPPEGSGAAYARFALREGNAIAVAAVAAGLEINGKGDVASARVALGAVSPTPVLVSDTEELLVGKRLDETLCAQVAESARNACDPISDVRGTKEFRREIVGVLTVRALQAAQTRAMEAQSC
ncbi:MAG: FAD binding domain-containing protein [Planctomycetota bacterium]|jgi:carbon-monoxide dehydrogenase medium subunit